MDKKTVGILTFHNALNYGAVLQAFALKTFCDELGYDAHIVNYTGGKDESGLNPLLKFLTTPNKKRATFRLCRDVMSYTGDKRRQTAFADFRKRYLAESKPCRTAGDIAALGYDIYISGSDQIWNYRITGNQFNPVYFGNFTNSARQIIYAASAQDTPFPLDMELQFREMLKSTSAAISIREQALAAYAQKLTGLLYPVVLDPVLLAGQEIIERITEGNYPKQPYILVYQIDRNPSTDISVNNLKKRFGCAVYTMTVPRLGSIRGRKGDVGPGKFIALLKNAEFLVTNSFHGIALSLMFEKNFYVYENGGVMSRIDSLLDAVDLHDRKVKMVADIDLEKKIDFIRIRRRLEELREASATFLIKALNGEMNQIFTSQKDSVMHLQPIRAREEKDCSGCTACATICPVSAIRMVPNQEGFLYPEINETICIHCGKCDKVCGFQEFSERETGFELPQAFGVKHKNDAVRQSSRSGAAFIAFSDFVLSQGGIVYGAAMQEDFSVSHIRAENADQRDRMKKAKYVQSDVTGVFRQVETDLKAGRLVLFSGTPCQVSGLRAMLEDTKTDTTQLVCCDLVCHGVPSPIVWKDYLQFIQEKYGPIKEADFRDKSFGWNTHYESFVVSGKNKKVVSRDYTDMFYEHIMFRPACHNCRFANVKRPGDLTLADFWGIEKNDPSFDDNYGVSLVLVNNSKGMDLLEIAKKDINFISCELTNCIQPTLIKPSTPSLWREQFWLDYRSMPFEAVLKKYTRPATASKRIKRNIKRFLYRLRLRQMP